MKCAHLFFVTSVLWLASGCFVNPPPQDVQRRGGSRQTDTGQDDDAMLTIEVIGTYRHGDAEYVGEQIKAMLPENIRNYSWSGGGNRFSYKLPPVFTAEALAKRVRFGKVIDVAENRIRVQYRYDHSVPSRFQKELTGYYKPPDDLLGPALEKHRGDWWAALGELKVTRQRNEQGEITRVDLPAFKTTDETMSSIAKLKTLKTLNLSMARHVTDKGARHLAGLQELEKLDLFGSSIGDPGQVHLSNLTNLKHLNLSGNGTEDGLRHLANLTGIERLSIGFGVGYPITGEGLEHLRAMKDLQYLRLDGCEISDDALRVIAGFSKMKYLRLQGGTMTNDGLAHLSGLAQLRELTLRDCAEVGDDGVAHLRPLKRLAHLNLHGTQVTDRGVEHLQSLGGIVNLTLSNTRVGDAGVGRLEPLAELKYLNLDQTEISDTSLEHLKSMSGLSNLCLSDTKITDAGLQHVGDMTWLRAVQIDGTDVTDAGMAHLSRLTELRSLDLSHTAVTEQGLQHFRSAPNLRKIRAEDSGLTERAIEKFHDR